MKYNHLGGCRTIDEYVRRKLEALNRTDRTFADFFEFMFSEKEAVLYERSVGYKIVKTTYGEAYDCALRKAVGLRDRLPDASQNATVGIYMENGVEWIEAFWAVLAAGFCPLLLNLRLDPAELERALMDCEAVAVLADEATFSVPTIPFASIETGGGERPEGAFGARLYVMSTGTSAHVKVCAYGAKEFACLLNDSAYIIRVCAQMKRHYKGELKQLTFLPFYHVFGLIATYIWFAFFSRTFVHLNDLEPATILNTIRRHEVTHIFAVPLFWERIYEKADQTIAGKGEATVKKYRKGLAIGQKLEAIPPLAKAFRRVAFREVREQLFGDSVQFMITGGSPIRSEALDFFNNIGYHLANGYGMTEIGITSVELSLDARVRKSGSVGKPLPSISYRVNEDGVLMVRGDSMAASIRKDGQETARGDDWFVTGDLAECRDGFYRILGRSDDLILLPNGEMLNPNLIEPNFLLPGVSEVCLINAATGGAVRPTLLLAVDRGMTRDQLIALESAVSERLVAGRLDTQIPGLVFVRGSMLGASDFKLNRGAITRRYLSGMLETVTPDDAAVAAAETDLEWRVATVFATAIGRSASDIGLDADFFRDLGGSSLDYFAMTEALKDTFGLAFVEDGETSFHTVRDVCRYIEKAGVHAP